MKKIITLAVGSALVVLTLTTAASATERKHVRRHVQPPAASTQADPRNAFDFYPDDSASRAAAFGVPQGLIYGGATSAPAGR